MAHFYYIANGLYIERKELDQVCKQLAAFKRGKLNIIGVERPANKGVVGGEGGQGRCRQYPMQRRRPSASGLCANTKIKTTRTVSVLQSTMPSKRTSNDIDFVEPTQYNV